MYSGNIFLDNLKKELSSDDLLSEEKIDRILDVMQEYMAKTTITAQMEIYNAKANECGRNGDYEKAIEYLNKAMKLDPSPFNTFYQQQIFNLNGNILIKKKQLNIWIVIN